MSGFCFFALSEKGLRDNNEDSYCAGQIGDFDVLGVADGLGGHDCGEVASGIAIECLKNAMRFYEGEKKTLLANAVFDAHGKILAEAVKSESGRTMATTLIAACVDDDLNCTIVNVGDCRAHFFSAGDVRTTVDHSYVNELLASGEITQAEAWRHPMSTVLTRALGDTDNPPVPDFYEANLHDTYLLLSSDGLHDFVTMGRIREIVLANGRDIGLSVRDLVKEALASGSDDNITVVLAYGMP